MPNELEQMFEDMFGFGKPEDPPEPKTRPHTPDPKAGEAARAVQAALLEHTGRRRKVDAWKPVAAKVLGVSRLYQNRWDDVLAKGQALGLFTIDTGSLSYPVLIPVEPEPEPEPEEEYPTLPTRPPLSPAVSPDLPEDWVEPDYLDCGHLDWGNDHTEARAEGHCCLASKMKLLPNYRFRCGEYAGPVPERHRRTKEKVAGGGFPGLCCDVDGYYIGGTFNDCRRVEDGPCCEVHTAKAK